MLTMPRARSRCAQRDPRPRTCTTVLAYPEDTLCTVANLFAKRHITSTAVVDRHSAAVLGLFTLVQLLDRRLKDLAEEHDRGPPLNRKRER